MKSATARLMTARMIINEGKERRRRRAGSARAASRLDSCIRCLHLDHRAGHRLSPAARGPPAPRPHDLVRGDFKVPASTWLPRQLPCAGAIWGRPLCVECWRDVPTRVTLPVCQVRVMWGGRPRSVLKRGLGGRRGSARANARWLRHRPLRPRWRTPFR